jgi:hypothetical protein
MYAPEAGGNTTVDWITLARLIVKLATAITANAAARNIVVRLAMRLN